MNILIKPVSTVQQRDQFIRYPYQLYASCPYWVPPLLLSQKELLSEMDPFWKKNKSRFFLAYDGDQIVGRIAAFTNSDHSIYFGRNDGFFGFFEAKDNGKVFEELLMEAEAFLKDQGCSKIIGPVNPTIHHELGVLTKGFDQFPFFMLTYNHSYYDARILEAGYQKLMDFSSYQLKPGDFQHTEKIARVKNFIQEKYHLTIRTPRVKDFEKELKALHEIYNDAFINHWGFFPMSWEDFYLLGKQMKLILDEEMVLIAELHGKPIGFLLAIPNLNEVLVKIKNGRLFPFGLIKLLHLKSKIKSLRVITIAVKKEFQHLGLGSFLYPEIARRAKIRGYENTELSWVVEDNVQMNKVCKEVGGQVSKMYRVYQKG
jgi:GNAT superfamily N-acetyltransferase